MSRTRTSSRQTAMSAAAGGLGLTLVATAALMGPASATPSPKVTLCHATSSAQNPYQQITVTTSSVAEGNQVQPNGHGTHTGPVFDPQGGQHQPAWGDIVPAFSGANSFAGLNLSDAGRAILAHACDVTVPSPSESESEHSTPSPTESEGHHGTPTPAESESEHSTPTPTESESEHSTPTPTESESEHSTPTPTPTPTETTPDPTPTETTPTPTPTETTPDPTPTETTPTPDPVPTEPTPDPGTPTDAPTSTPVPTPSTSTSETPESLPLTGGRTTGLPQTGSSAALVAVLGAGLLGLGGVTMIAGRRRPATDDADDVG